MGSVPVSSVRSWWFLRRSSTIFSLGSRLKWGCSYEWFPISWPRAAIFFTYSG